MKLKLLMVSLNGEEVEIPLKDPTSFRLAMEELEKELAKGIYACGRIRRENDEDEDIKRHLH